MNKDLSVVFDYIIAEDFNPDLVQLGLMDAYDLGYHKAITKTLKVGAVIFCGVALCIGTQKLIETLNKKTEEYKDEEEI